MTKRVFATRLPESQRTYIRYKAMDSGKEQQELVSEMIAFYQRHDTVFMAKFAALIQPTDSADKGTGDDS